jgi:hypothetical protein
LHEEHKQIIHEETRGPVVTERTEKPIVTEEIREPIVEKHVEKPIVKEEIGTTELMKCDKEGCNDANHLHERKHGLGQKIKEVWGDIKSSVSGNK